MMRPHCELSDRFLCNIFDGGQIAASMVIQPNAPTDISKLQVVRMGPFTVLPAGLNAIQGTFAPNVGSLIQLRDLSSQIMKNNTGIYRQHPEMFGENQPEKTARQVAEESTKEARHEKSHVAFRYTFYDRLYREMFRRTVSRQMLQSDESVRYPGKAEAREFFARCVARGVPEEIVMQSNSLFRVYATRAIGLGSLGVRLDLTNQLLQIRGMLDEEGKENAIREWLTVRVGHRNVDRFKSPMDRDEIPSNEMSIATLENNDFVEGAQVPVGADQNHVVHIRIHLRPIQEVIELFDQTQGEGFNFRMALAVLQLGLPHIGGHMQYLQEDPAYEQFLAELNQFLQQAVQLSKLFEKQVQREQEAQAQMQQQQAERVAEAEGKVNDAELMLEKYKIDKEAEIEGLKQQSLNSMRAMKTQEQLEILRQKADASLELNKEKALADIEVQARKADADIAIKQAAAAEDRGNTGG
jgi:hypothetical protein